MKSDSLTTTITLDIDANVEHITGKYVADTDMYVLDHFFTLHSEIVF